MKKDINLNREIKRQAIREIIRHKLSKDPKLFEKEVKKINKLDLSLFHLESVEGIWIFENLKYLDLSCNSIQDVSELNNLTKLKVINLEQTKVDEISKLNQLTNLEILALNHCDVSNISVVENLQQLQELYLSYNEIRELEQLEVLLELPNLKAVKLTGNPCFMKLPGSLSVDKLKNIPIISKLEDKGVQVLFHPDERYEDSNMPYFETIPGVIEESDNY
ncbi:leucine-rich repeat domain-containing protein [Halanaerobacter jeridensis]|uniref:Leucine-rich repeat (LRR) protein n=1 Tax=Halanaerobacter jeridensis TaxID=706427 RepID=A0A939BMY7_9FIRM|nr:leucine-rich repeat domain-containing protein [Halanaerobacter jeridensis]MBM7557780.1 Leucine-rich repeat (LRR) protein [Halanaerobacter jeridensis]